MTEHPEIADRVRKEIDDVIGGGRIPVIEDRGSLPYAEATLYEVLRYSSIAPILLPHATTCDTTLSEYCILFVCLRYKVAGGIMFLGCPSVRPILVIALSQERD